MRTDLEEAEGEEEMGEEAAIVVHTRANMTTKEVISWGIFRRELRC